MGWILQGAAKSSGVEGETGNGEKKRRGRR